MMEQIQDSRLAEAAAALDSGEYAKGFALFERLAQSGSTIAMVRLANIFATGRVPDVERDYSKALYWLERAYRNGSRGAAIDLCKIYSQGDDKYGVLADEEKAFRYIRMFEDIGRPNLAQALGVFMVANHYQRGAGVAKNLPKALELYRRAATAGHIPSKINGALLQIRRGNLLAIASWLFAVIHGQFLVLTKGSRRAWQDPRMSL